MVLGLNSSELRDLGFKVGTSCFEEPRGWVYYVNLSKSTVTHGLWIAQALHCHTPKAFS